MEGEMNLGEIIALAWEEILAGTLRNTKRVPYDMVDEYTPEGWVVVERHDTYVTMEKIGGGE